MNVVKKVAGSEDKFVATLCSASPRSPSSRGVYTEDGLKERFCKVEATLIRRVARVGEKQGQST